MKRYNVAYLYVLTIDGRKYICEETHYVGNFKEVLSGRRIEIKDEFKLEGLSRYYSVDYKSPKPLILTKKDILDKYIKINSPEDLDTYYPEKTELSSLISQTIPDTDHFYKTIGENLTLEEREHIKSKVDKSCNTCTNGCCRVEQDEKPVSDCIGWENNRIVGEYKVLKLNRRSKA